MISGLTISMVSGVPLGTIIGNHYGYQSLFLLITLLSLTVLLSIVFLMPSDIQGQKTRLSGLVDGLKSLQMWRVFIITAGFCGSIFTLYTYVEPFFIHLGGLNHSQLSLVLLVYGIFGILGNLFGGKLADKKGDLPTLRLTLSLLSLSLAGLFFTIDFLPLAILNFCMVSFWGFSCVASVKIFALRTAGTYTPQSVESSISLNEASFNLGIALATLAGGLMLSFSVAYNPILASLIALVALLLIPKSH